MFLSGCLFTFWYSVLSVIWSGRWGIISMGMILTSNVHVYMICCMGVATCEVKGHSNYFYKTYNWSVIMSFSYPLNNTISEVAFSHIALFRVCCFVALPGRATAARPKTENVKMI